MRKKPGRKPGPLFYKIISSFYFLTVVPEKQGRGLDFPCLKEGLQKMTTSESSCDGIEIQKQPPDGGRLF